MRTVIQRPFQCLLAATCAIAEDLDYDKLAETYPANTEGAAWPPVMEWAMQNLSSSLVRLWLRTISWRGSERRAREGSGLLIFKKPTDGLRHAVSYRGRLIVDPREGQRYTSLWQLARAYGVKTTEIEVYRWDRKRLSS